MKHSLILFSLLLFISSAYSHSEFMHLPLDLRPEESRELFNKANISLEEIQDSNVRASIAGGEKLSKWIKNINDSRSIGDKIRLSDPKLRKGIPIDSPKKYGPSTILARLEEIKSELPKEMKEIIYSTKKSTNTLPEGVSKELFIEHARKVNRLYQTAVRWQTAILPWKSYYQRAKSKDIRGFYFLKNQLDLNQKLQNFNELSSQQQQLFQNALIGICYNTKTNQSKCRQELKQKINAKNVISYKNKYWKRSKSIWDGFFKISNPRRDVEWNNSNPSKMITVFKNPNNRRIQNFLSDNIEDEFKNDFWNLEMDFITGNFSTAKLKFKPGVTPHVTGGNTIVMDANTPIEEYSVKWTIRHEFGHILRLPDCYHEFYDEEQNVAINYQLDVTDLMCSRAGDFNERIYNELKEAYFKN